MTVLVAISVGATYAFTSEFSGNSGAPLSGSGAFLTGHVQAIVTDENGNIIAYRQADNAIVLGGMDIIADQVFQDHSLNLGNHTNVTGSNGGGAVGWMNIGNNTGGFDPEAIDVGLACPLFRAGISTCGATLGQQNSPRGGCNGVISDISSSGGRDYLGPLGSAQVNVTAVSTFDGLVCNSIAIQEAAMWNNATGPWDGGDNGTMFARNVFGAVTLTTTDSLELTWRFTFTDN